MTVKRLFSAVTGTAGSTATDGLDELRWRLLGKKVIAASTGDPTAAHRACSQLAQQWPSEPRDGHAAVHLWYLIRHRVLELLGRAPTEDDLHDLAVRFNPRFARIGGRQDANLLERTLRTYYELSTLDDEVAGGLLVVAGSAALGVMLDNPRAQLKAMRPHLANWLRDNRDYLSGIGLVQNPPGPLPGAMLLEEDGFAGGRSVGCAGGPLP